MPRQRCGNSYQNLQVKTMLNSNKDNFFSDFPTMSLFTIDHDPPESIILVKGRWLSSISNLPAREVPGANLQGVLSAPASSKRPMACSSIRKLSNDSLAFGCSGPR